METVARPDQWRGSDLRTRSEVVTYLKQRGGEVVSKQGLAAGEMREALARGRALGQLLVEMERDGMIEREVRGRRTFRIKLIDDWGLGDGAAIDLSRMAAAEQAQREMPAAEMPAIDSDVDLTQLAEALLAVVLKRASQPAADQGYVERLKAAIQDGKNDAMELRHQLELERSRANEAEEQVRILTHNLEQVKRELDKPRRGQATIADRLSGSERRMLDQLMRELPKGQ